MNRQMTNSVRKYGPRSMINDSQFKTLIREELKEIINSSVQDYLQNNKIPVASIDIKLEKDCKHCAPENHRLETPSNIRLNISTSTLNKEVNANIENEMKREPSNKNENDNVHWMTWKDSTPFFTKKSELKNYRVQTAQNSSSREHKCSTPFMRPNTSHFTNNNRFSYSGANENNFNGKELSIQNCRPCSRDSVRRFRCMSADQFAKPSQKTTSVAVGPDKHFDTIAINTRQSYQISDYLKKSMNLNDPYERKIFSSLMEVLRKKNRNPSSIDTESIAADPVMQLSEYKSKFRNPQNKSVAFPTSKTENVVTVKRPLVCLHKTRPLGQLRPQSSTVPRFQHGEQFLY